MQAHLEHVPGPDFGPLLGRHSVHRNDHHKEQGASIQQGGAWAEQQFQHIIINTRKWCDMYLSKGTLGLFRGLRISPPPLPRWGR